MCMLKKIILLERTLSSGYSKKALQMKKKTKTKDTPNKLQTCSLLKLVDGGEGANIVFQWCLVTFFSTAAKQRPFPGQNQSTLK